MSQKQTEMLDHYDFSQGVRGKYAKHYAEGQYIVLIESDVVEFLPDDESVNETPIKIPDHLPISNENRTVCKR